MNHLPLLVIVFLCVSSTAVAEQNQLISNLCSQEKHHAALSGLILAAKDDVPREMKDMPIQCSCIGYSDSSCCVNKDKDGCTPIIHTYLRLPLPGCDSDKPKDCCP